MARNNKRKKVYRYKGKGFDIETNINLPKDPDFFRYLSSKVSSFSKSHSRKKSNSSKSHSRKKSKRR